MGAMTAALSRATDRVYTAFGKAAVYTDRIGVSTPCTVLEEQDFVALWRDGASQRQNRCVVGAGG